MVVCFTCPGDRRRRRRRRKKKRRKRRCSLKVSVAPGWPTITHTWWALGAPLHMVMTSQSPCTEWLDGEALREKKEKLVKKKKK